MSKVKGKGNRSTEARVAGRLTEDGVEGWKQHPVEILGKPDIYFPILKLAIFVDGCFWHGCPICQRNIPKTRTEFWAKKIALNRARDLKVNRGLKKTGVSVLRIWEHEVTANTWYPKFKRRWNRLVRQEARDRAQTAPALAAGPLERFE